MELLNMITIGIVVLSLLGCLLVIREFLDVAHKREELLRGFQQDMRGTKQSRTILISVYAITTIIATLGFAWWFYALLT